MKRMGLVAWSCSCLAVVACACGLLYANGGPFVIKYPGGDPAAKGVFARLDDTLKPGREERLKVVKEDLAIAFGLDDRGRGAEGPPRVQVSAAYTIENPTDKEVEVDFGFPILRGVYMREGMSPFPDLRVTVSRPATAADGPRLPPPSGASAEVLQYPTPTIISNSAIYGIIRASARERIDKAVAADAALTKLAGVVKSAPAHQRGQSTAAFKAVAAYATGTLKWNERDAALLAEYVGLEFGKEIWPKDRSPGWYGGVGVDVSANLGPLAAIGEQKATQFFAQLATAFDANAAAAYEAIFTAWGGEVKERSVDLQTGKVRPREIAVDAKKLAGADAPNPYAPYDPTVYARVDYLDEKAKITESENASCRDILKNLPVVFTFAPMNLIHYQVKFPAKSTQVLTVAYSQYAYQDTAGAASYQLAYVVHPASMWKEFGPIQLSVSVPGGVPFRASVDCRKDDRAMSATPVASLVKDTYRATLTDKTGEIFLAVDAAAWDKTIPTASAGRNYGLGKGK